ncbi:MAG: hypothetical protein HQM09_21470, partial [Candidatus Riflebacteria bacterium]|nr:hypothetical protein [Candidatus Riflebacteria bacterium]
ADRAPKDWDIDGMVVYFLDKFNFDISVLKSQIPDLGPEELVTMVYARLKEIYAEKEAKFGIEQIRRLERMFLLHTIDHKWIEKFIEHRIADKRILRLVKKWLKAGVIEEGHWRASEEGAPQGASISPLLSNIYLHYVLDLWINQWRKRNAQGDVVIVRWADDFVVGFQYQYDAKRFLTELGERFRKFSLELHPEKTRLIRFGRYARRDCQRYDGKKKPETFNFLGFTHCCDVKRNGKFKVMRKTMGKRFTAKIHAVKEELRIRMHQSVKEQGKWLRSVLLGYFAYHAIPGNWGRIGGFRTQVGRMWYRTLRRRSQKATITWAKMAGIIKQWLPPARILHKWPEERFLARTQGKSPVR